MSNTDRRDFLRLGLVGGVGALVASGRLAVAAQPSRYLASSAHLNHPLEFRIDSEFKPDLSGREAELLRRAVMEFLYKEHTPRSVKMMFWNENPRDLEYLEKHIERVIDSLFAGVEENMAIRPVDPMLILALLYNESRFHPKVVSRAGAVGMAQFMPETATDYGLTPLARTDLWQEYLDARAQYRADRRLKRAEFRKRFGLTSTEPEDVIDAAIEKQDLSLLRAYREIPDEPTGADAALERYIEALRADFAKQRFFPDGHDALARVDGRVGYKPVERAVKYIARSLAEYQGVATTAAAAYNAGPGAVKAGGEQSILRRFGKIPMYDETVLYIQRLIAVYSALKYQLFSVSA